MSCITLSVAFYAFLRRSEALTSNRHQVVSSVLFIVPCVEVACKGLFLIQKEQGEALVFNHSQQCFGHMPHFRVYNYNFYSVFFNYSNLLLLH